MRQHARRSGPSESPSRACGPRARVRSGSDGSITAYGIYDFSILLISTVSSLVSFAIVLWGLSRSFTLPGTNIVLPGFLFWVALLYAGLGTLITHLIGRPLINLYFQRQHMEADFRFSLAPGGAGAAPTNFSSARRVSSDRKLS